MASLTIYKNSFLATLCSIAGYILIVSGIMVAFGGQIIGGILLALLGLVFAVWASNISENKRFKTWKKQVEEKGLVPVIKGSVPDAVKIYNTYPSTKTLEYIRSLNPQAGEFIAQQLNAKKK